MRKLRSVVLVALALLIFVPASSYAIVDFGVYGGYSFTGKIQADTVDKSTKGWEYGFLGHLNGSVIPMVLSVGIGGFYQKAPLKYSVSGTDFDLTKTAYGLDGIVMLELPIIIHPYVRGGIAINEKAKIEVSGPAAYSTSKSKKFNSYYVGLGAAFTIFPMIQLFGEYMYNTSKQEDNVDLTSNSIHVGARLSI